jgi:hypothetical protein
VNVGTSAGVVCTEQEECIDRRAHTSALAAHISALLWPFRTALAEAVSALDEQQGAHAQSANSLMASGLLSADFHIACCRLVGPVWMQQAREDAHEACCAEAASSQP